MDTLHHYGGDGNKETHTCDCVLHRPRIYNVGWSVFRHLVNTFKTSGGWGYVAPWSCQQSSGDRLCYIFLHQRKIHAVSRPAPRRWGLKRGGASSQPNYSVDQNVCSSFPYILQKAWRNLQARPIVKNASQGKSCLTLGAKKKSSFPNKISRKWCIFVHPIAQDGCSISFLLRAIANDRKLNSLK